MALIALLSAREGARERLADGRTGPLIGFGGQSLVEYQARAAISAGAERILILTEAATPDLGQLIDRLGAASGVQAALVQDMVTLSRGIGVRDRLLLIGENVVVPLDALSKLAGGEAPALLTVADVPATSGFERIDGDAKWAGALAVPGDTLLATLDMLGDWDLSLTLLRRTVQNGADRIPLSPELVMDGHLTIVRDQESAQIALRARAEQDRREATAGAGPIGHLLAPLSRVIVQALVRREIEPTLLRGMALTVAALALAAASGGFAALALLVMLVAVAVDELARQSARITLRESGTDWRAWAVSGAGLAVLAILGWRLAGGTTLALTGAWLPVALVGLLAWRRTRDRDAGLWSGWTAMTVPLALLIALLGTLLSVPDLSFALLALLAAIMIALRFLLDDGAKI